MEDLSPIGWAATPFTRYADFRGRAPRAEYWWYTLGIMLLLAGTVIMERIAGVSRVIGSYGPFSLLVLLTTVVCSLAVQVRRLHDTNRSGWWLLILYVPEVLFPLVTAATGRNGGVALTAIEILLALILLVAIFMIFVFFVQKGTDGLNRYGPNPYGPSELQEVFA